MTPKQGPISWDSAGVRLERPIGDSSVWAPPPLDCKDGVLRYEVGKYQLRTVDRSMLFDFLRLAEAQDDGVYRFSVKWGALGLCQHGLPYWHSAACSQRNSSGNIRSEKVEDWRTMAAAFKSLINISGELNQERTGLIDDWRFADRRLSEPDFAAWDDDVLQVVLMDASTARTQLLTLMRRLIWLSDITVRLDWNQATGSWAISLDSNHTNLLGQLTLGLLLTMTDKEGFAVCSFCHQSYLPKRKPDPTRRHYCPKCGVKAAWRDAARARRERCRMSRSPTLGESIQP